MGMFPKRRVCFWNVGDVSETSSMFTKHLVCCGGQQRRWIFQNVRYVVEDFNIGDVFETSGMSRRTSCILRLLGCGSNGPPPNIFQGEISRLTCSIDHPPLLQSQLPLMQDGTWDTTRPTLLLQSPPLLLQVGCATLYGCTFAGFCHHKGKLTAMLQWNSLTVITLMWRDPVNTCCHHVGIFLLFFLLCI